jgi:hypothetical protein
MTQRNYQICDTKKKSHKRGEMHLNLVQQPTTTTTKPFIPKQVGVG